MNKFAGALFGAILFILLLSLIAVGGRYITYRQTDPDDIVTRDRIDRQIDALFERFDRQIQADTTKLTYDQLRDTVQLENKFPDKSYTVIILMRVIDGGSSWYSAYPLSDSSFVVLKTSTIDKSSLNWVAIYKRD